MKPADVDSPVFVTAYRNVLYTSSLASSATASSVSVERKHNFVDNLVDSSTQIVEAIWPTSSVVCREEASNSSVLPLRTFIQETLRRSRTSYSTLQVALYYLVLIKDHLPDRDFTMEQTDDCHASRALQCGRRMFLAALILASKYLQDRNYSARAWSKISGLATHEINQNEMAFLLAVNWNLHVTEEVYNRWTDCVMKFTPSQPPSPGSGVALVEFEHQCEDFKRIILQLNADLDNLEDIVSMGGFTPAPSMSPRSLSPRSVLAAAQDKPGRYDCATPTPRAYTTPNTMEPAPSPAHTVVRLPPTFGLLPTPRLTPQPNGKVANYVFTTELLHGNPSVFSCKLSLNTIFTRVNDFGHVPNVSFLLNFIGVIAYQRAAHQVGCAGALPFCEAV
ncbi:hypothetical protein INS49_001479 [Diaporthe citri]|uniref:uncharacterized protein n=1 Tax=Diaporthe citri TaxID=83186 RepID=UPI001C803378|nr:uncharacterized protein INS49_001479 [Diaporthe citri]KAG6367292.1 hypothetical protein INS49_001479 [Diaporthe citri]